MGSKTKVGFIIGIILTAAISVGWFYYENNKPISVRIGYLTGDLHHLAFFVAQEKGFFNASGINMTGVAFSSGNEIMINYESTSRSIDMAYSGIAPAVLHRMNNAALNITILAAANVNGSALVVRNSSAIMSGADLVGKTIAVPALNNMQDFILSMILNQSNIARSQITVRTMTGSNMVLDKFNTLDGYIGWEPYNAQGLDNGLGKYLYKSGEIWKNHPCCVVSAHNDFIQQHPDIVKRVLAVHKQATEFILAHPDEAKSIAMNKMGLTEQQATVALDNTAYLYTSELTEYITFVEKLLALNSQAQLTASHLPAGLTATTFVEDYFFDFSVINSL